MAITISGENNNDRILASDGVIDQISGINIVGLITASHINVGSNIQLGNAGIVSATTFVGNVTGNVNSTSPLLLQTGGSERFRITGDNELGIAGANYGTAGQVLTSGGSGSAVTWSAIPTQVTIANNADNRVITGGSGTNLNGESNLTFDGTTLSVTGAADLAGTLIFQPGGTAWSTTNTRPQLGRQADGELRLGAGSDSSSIITFYTSPSAGGTLTERLRITTDGDMGIGDNNPNIRLTVVDSGTENLVRLGRSDGNSHGSHTVNIKASKDFYHNFKMEASSYQLHTYTGSAMGERFRIESDGDFRLSSGDAETNYGWIRGWSSSTGDMIISADHSATGSNGSNLIFRTRGTERARIQGGGLKMNGGSYIVEVAAGHGAPNNNTKIMDQRRWMWYGASSSTHTVARVAKAASGQPGDGDSQLAAWIVTYTARSMYGFNSDGGYSVMKMRTGRFDYNDNEVRFSTEQDTLGTGSGSQNPTIVFTDEGSGVVRISITNPSSTHSFGEINLMTYDCRITLPTG